MHTLEGRYLLPLNEHVNDELRLYGKEVLTEIEAGG